MDNLGLLSSLHFPNVLLPCSPFMYSALMMASLYGCRCFMCKKNSLKRSLANCEPSLSEFSLSKCRRLDREGNSLASLGDAGSSSHKCAGTQTLFSSFVPIRNFYPPQPPHDTGHDMTIEEEPRFILDLDHHMAKSSQVHPGVVLGGLQQQQPTSPPLEAESSNAPLNLTLSPSSKSSLRSQPIARDAHCAGGGGWSAITGGDHTASARLASGWACDGRDPPAAAAAAAPSANQPPSDLDKTTTRPQTEHHIWSVAQDSSSRANAKNKQQSNSPRKITSVVTVECDKGIEEHFERSLGKDYPKCIAKGKSSAESILPVASDPVPARRNGAVQTSPTNDIMSDSAKGNSAVSGAVDDHFAKSLGQTWTKLKSQNVQTDLRMPQPGSVDDHFAKALGQETWFKLRVKKEGT